MVMNQTVTKMEKQDNKSETNEDAGPRTSGPISSSEMD
jgi:hypothetical protein